MRVAAVILALVLAGCAGAPEVDEPKYGRIDGAVVDQILRPFSHLNVTLVNLDRVAKTTEMGGFSFVGVLPGTYTLTSQAPGTLGDVKVVQVEAGKVTRVILQLLPLPSKEPFTTSLRNRAQEDLAMPGTPCASCGWGTFLLRHPDEVVVRANWDSLPSTDATVTMEVRDDQDRLIGSATGASPLEVDLSSSDVAAEATRLKISFRFTDTFTPQPFEVESFLDLYYNGSKQG